MTDLRFSGGHRLRLPTTPAFGPAEPLGRRGSAVRLAILAGMLALALLVRFTGLLHPVSADPLLPPLPGVHAVAPWLVRGGQPQESDLVRMRDKHRVGAVIDVDGADTEEQAVARGLGLRTLHLDVADGQAPSADQVLTLVRFLSSTEAGRAAGDGGNGVVYLHDTTGRGPVLVVAAVMQLLHGVPLTAVLQQLSPDELRGISAEQLAALQEIAAVALGRGTPTGSYEALRGVTW